MEIYQDENLIALNKPSGIAVSKEVKTKESLEDIILKKYPYLKNLERSGIIHRLDKETSGVLLVAKSEKNLIFFQKQFKTRYVEKEYIALIEGKIKDKTGTIKTLLGRSPANYKKQKVFLEGEPDSESKREAITDYEIIEALNNHTLVKVFPRTGRKHQIRCHFAFLNHPVSGDKLYGFKNSVKMPRLFLHAFRIKIQMPSGGLKEFKAELPQELKEIINKIKKSSASKDKKE